LQRIATVDTIFHEASRYDIKGKRRLEVNSKYYIGDLEIDFVCERAESRTYVQVAYVIESAATLERELRPLLGIPDAYPQTAFRAEFTVWGDGATRDQPKCYAERVGGLC